MLDRELSKTVLRLSERNQLVFVVERYPRKKRKYPDRDLSEIEESSPFLFSFFIPVTLTSKTTDTFDPLN